LCKPEWLIPCVHPVNHRSELWMEEENLPRLHPESRSSRRNSGRRDAKQASGADFHS
jgi:hypothetical protein